jgi:hypothetical protein
VKPAKETKFSDDIRILGNKKAVDKAQDALKKIANLDKMTEGNARLRMQQAIDENHLTASILYRGNRVWSKVRILRNLDQIIAKGTLYGNKRVRWMKLGSMLTLPATPQDFIPILSDYFYGFLHLNCGSIAHYDKAGWIGHYPTLDDLKQFFLKNEHGKRVIEWIPAWKTDVRNIVEAIEVRLFPLQSYVRWKQKSST